MEVVASLSQGRTAAAQCGLFTRKSVPVIFEPPCTMTNWKVSVTDKLKITCKTLLGMRVNCRLIFEHCSGGWNRNHEKMKHDRWTLGQQ